MFHLVVFADEDATGLVLIAEQEKKVQLLNVALKVSNKSTYTSWIRYVRRDERRGKGVTLEGFPSYWLSRYILRSGLEDEIVAYVFPLVVLLVEGKAFPL